MARLVVLALFAATLAAAPQAPPIQNGRVEIRQTTAIDSELTALASLASEPLWAGWRVPIADGHRGGCCTYSDDAVSVRGCLVESSGTRPRGAVPSGAPLAAVPLDAGTGLVVLARVTSLGLERLRMLGDDCPLDAGGKIVHWLQGVTPAESLRFLDSLVRRAPPVSNGSASQEPRLKETALSAAALHRDAGADALLDRLAADAADTSLRRHARSLLGSARGAHGVATLRRLLEQERVPDVRRQLVAAIGASRQPDVPELLLRIAKNDADVRVRGEAAYYLPQRGGVRVLPDVAALIAGEASEAVKRRAVQGLGRLAAPEVTAALIQLASSSPNAAVKKEAVAALGRSNDPAAVAFLEALIGK